MSLWLREGGTPLDFIIVDTHLCGFINYEPKEMSHPHTPLGFLYWSRCSHEPLFLYLYVYTCKCAQAWVCANECAYLCAQWALRLRLGFFNHSSLYLLRQGPLSRMEFSSSTILAGTCYYRPLWSKLFSLVWVMASKFRSSCICSECFPHWFISPVWKS